MAPKKCKCNGNVEAPPWLETMFKRWDDYLSRFDRLYDLLFAMQESQNAILRKIEMLENRFQNDRSTNEFSRSELYSTLVKFNADSRNVADKQCKIVWYGIDEGKDEAETSAFDREALNEVVNSSCDDELVKEWRSDNRCKILLTGDFNFPYIEWSSLRHRGGLHTPSSSAFLDFTTAFNLQQVVNRPTLGSNTLDIVLVSDIDMIDSTSLLPPFSTSDHCCITIQLSQSTRIHSDPFVPHLIFARADFDSIIQHLLSIDWVPLINYCTVNEAYSRFVATCQSLIHKYVPKSRSETKRIFSTKKIQRLRAKVDYYHANIERFGRSKFAKYAQKLRRETFRLAVAEEEKLAKAKNLRHFFSYCNKRLQVSEEIPDLVTSESNDRPARKVHMVSKLL
ncbi:hypothetical protein COOONC_18117 [Cooperia oncophora]